MKRATFHTEQLRKIGVAQRVDWAANPWVWVLSFRRVGDRGTFNGTERPIIFSAAMVNALLAGAKTQTRRLNRLPNSDPDRGVFARLATRLGKLLAVFHDSIPDDPVPLEIACPFGQVGDRLWVREGIRCNPDKRLVFSGPGHYGSVGCFIADATPIALDKWKWKNKALPAIHMPRDLCRIVLEITEIRCERLQSITDLDALAEGVRQCFPGAPPREAFEKLWTSIHGADVFPKKPRLAIHGEP